MHKSVSSNSKVKSIKEKWSNRISSLTQTARELTRTTRKDNWNWKQNIKTCLSSSKISSWIEALNNYSCTDINLNAGKGYESNLSEMKRRNKSGSSTSNTRKKDKYEGWMNKTIDRRSNLDISNSKDLNNQFISIIK